MSRIVLFTLPFLLALSACSKKAVRPSDHLVEVPSAAASPVAGEAGEARTGSAAGATERPLSLPIVYFEFDSFVIAASARTALEGFARDYRATQRPLKVVIAGHADERGTEEYNLVLGQKRASAVRTYLTRLGVDEKALVTVSYGEARPVKHGKGEDAWSANRRAELTVSEAN